MTEQRTEEWFAKRAGKFTGSRFSDLMTKGRGGKDSATKTALLIQLAIERITGIVIDGGSSAAMRRGTKLEEEAITAYEMKTGLIVSPVGFIEHPRIAMTGASPDGAIGDDGLLEIKCPSSMEKHYGAFFGEHADEYAWQVQGELFASGRAWVDIASYHPDFPPGTEIAITRVTPNIDAHATLAGAIALAEREVQAIMQTLLEQAR